MLSKENKEMIKMLRPKDFLEIIKKLEGTFKLKESLKENNIELEISLKIPFT